MSTAASQNKEGTKITSEKKSAKDLKTEGPLSEKDEVKKAEQNISKQTKKAT